MSFVTVDGCRIHYEVTGEGPAIVFVHESAANSTHWKEQVAALSRRFRCIVYDARGYTPSDVPQDDASYGYEAAVGDLAAVVEAAAGGPAHIVGLSMGAYAGLVLALRRPDLVRSLTFAGGGAGSLRGPNETMRVRMEEMAGVFFEQGAAAATEQIAVGASRTGFQRRDPEGWQAWRDSLMDYSAIGRGFTYRNFQGLRPSIYEFERELPGIKAPVLLAVGDEDDAIHEVNHFLRKTLPNAGLWIVPRCGHAINLEYPEAFNVALIDFLGRVEAGRV